MVSLVKRVDVVHSGESNFDDPDWVYSNRKGSKIASGGYKTVYNVQGRPDLALVVAHGDNHIGEHSRDLERLASLGVPTATYIRLGKKKTALVKKYAGASKSHERRIKDLWKRRTVDDIVKIARTCKEKKIHIGDFQVLIGSKGEMVVSDPLTVEVGTPVSSHFPFYAGIVQAVAEAWADREGGTCAQRSRQIDSMINGDKKPRKKVAKKATKKKGA